VDASNALIVSSKFKTAATAEFTSIGLRTVTEEMDGNIADHCCFHILFRDGGEYGGETPLLRSRPFLGWSEMLMMSGRLPQLSVQQEMLRTVCWTFLRFMAGYVTLLIAFAFSFYILFKGSSEEGNAEMFTNPFVPLLKTIVMFTGEFEASDLSFDTLP